MQNYRLILPFTTLEIPATLQLANDMNADFA